MRRGGDLVEKGPRVKRRAKKRISEEPQIDLFAALRIERLKNLAYNEYIS